VIVYLPAGSVVLPALNVKGMLNKSIFYTMSANNVTNIWSQPLDGGPAKQVTEFNDLFTTSFA